MAARPAAGLSLSVSRQTGRRPALVAGLALATSLALGGVSLVMPSAPTTDPWGWIVWGREIVHLDLSTAIGGSPSWKPLPVLFTAPLSVLGDGAPALWLLVARAGALLGLMAAYGLGNRLYGRAAGLLSALGILLSAGWLREFMHGYSEGLAIALLLLAVDRHLAGRRGQALALAAGVSLARPEAFALTLLYGVYLWRAGGPKLGMAVVALVVPALWLVPDWVGSGDPFHASAVSHHVLGSGPSATWDALREGARIIVLPLSLAALAGVAIALRRGDVPTIAMSALAVGWVLLLTLLFLGGYPTSGRFYVLPAALVAVVGAGGLVRLAELAPGGGIRLAVAAVVAVAVLPALPARVRDLRHQADAAVNRARLERSLDRALRRAGPARLRACGVGVLPDGVHKVFRGVVAWRLDVHLKRVRSVRTSALADIELLAKGDQPRSGRRGVVVFTSRRRFFFAYPLDGRPVRLAGRRPRPLKLAGSAGAWRLLLPAACARTVA